MKLHYLIFGLLVLLGLTSCDKGEDSNPEPATNGNIIGSVNLYDEGTTQIDNSNMLVIVEGITPVISAITDANGGFTLSDVPFGTYTLAYEKSGFGTFKKFDVDHTNMGSPTIIAEIPSLGQVSTTQITNLVASANGSNVTFSITTNPAGSNGNTRYVRYFLSTDSNVSNENYTYYSPGLISQINPYQITLSQNDLTSAGFSSGQTVFVKVYGDSFWSNEYDDLDLERKVFPNLNMASANAISFVVP